MELTDQRIVILIHGMVIALAMIGAIALLMGRRNVEGASLIGLASTCAGMLSPSPLSHKDAPEGADDAAKA